MAIGTKRKAKIYLIICCQNILKANTMTLGCQENKTKYKCFGGSMDLEKKK